MIQLREQPTQISIKFDTVGYNPCIHLIGKMYVKLFYLSAYCTKIIEEVNIYIL